MSPDRLERLLEAGRSLVSELDLGVLLDRLLDTARELTGARYAAVGILDVHRRELEQFLTRGVDEETHQAIGDLPRGRGVLGVLVDKPEPLRLSDVGSHPKSYGFPPGHPEMKTFLGVPVLIRGKTWGNLYLTEKEGGEDFTHGDERCSVVLAGWAGIAIENARLYEIADVRRSESEKALRGFEATSAIARAIGAETDLHRVLELIVKRGRALLAARSVLMLLKEGDVLRVAASAGQLAGAVARDVPVNRFLEEVLSSPRPVPTSNAAGDLGVSLDEVGIPAAKSAILMPLVYRGRPLGVLAAFDRLSGAPQFTRDDAELLEAFAASGAIAVATAQSVEAERLRFSLRSAEEERRRWARELHDETLQGLGALKVLLSGVRRAGGDAGEMRAALGAAIDHLDQDITNLRGILADLRPAALDSLGLGPALRTLAERNAVREGLEVRSDIDLARRLAPDLESTIYRVVQEALTNVAKHARAERVDIEVRDHDGEITVAVRDDGAGFGDAPPATGTGLIGMRERVMLAGGTLDLEPADPGTRVHARVPAVYVEEDTSSRPRSIA